MRARPALRPLSKQKTEENLGGSRGRCGGKLEGAALCSEGGPPGFRRAPREAAAGARPQEQCNSLLKRRDELCTEIKRGKEYLEKVRGEIAAIRVRLEGWPDYDKRCGGNRLPDLAQELLVKERVVQFLSSWIKRQEHELDAAAKALELAANQNFDGADDSVERSAGGVGFSGNRNQKGNAALGRQP